MTKAVRAVLLASLVLAAGVACARAAEEAKAPLRIAADVTWNADVTVDSEVIVEKGTLAVAPGVTVTFVPGGKITLKQGAKLVAVGTKEKPVRLVGKDAGHIGGWRCTVRLERCRVTGMGEAAGKRRMWMNLTPGPDGVIIRDCRIEDCAAMWLNLPGPVSITGCDFRRKGPNPGELGGIRTYGKGKLLIEGNSIERTRIGAGAGTEAVIRNNVVIGATIGAWKNRSLLVEGNYVHQPHPKGTYGLSKTAGTIRNNVVRGGSWTTAQIGGEITGNVLISLPHEGIGGPGDFDKNCTHEHICGLAPGSTVARNIFVGASYGGIMGIGPGTCSRSVVRNNTFDMKNRGTPIYLNHLPKSNPEKIVLRGNIFMRCTGILDEKGIPDSTSQIDFNLWADAGKKGRFRKVTMTGREPGGEGFGARDVPPTGALDPKAVVEDPDVKFPFPDDDMLECRHTVAEVLAFYRWAYSPRKGSPAVDAGDPADREDPAVTDGRPDIGAVELAKQPGSQGPGTQSP